MNGLKIHSQMTRDKCVNNRQKNIRPHEEDIREVERYVYVDNVVIKDGGTEATWKGKVCFHNPSTSTELISPLSYNKIRISYADKKTVSLYGVKTCRKTKTKTHKLQAITNENLKLTLNMRSPDADPQCWSVGQSRTQPNRSRSQDKEVGVDRPHSAEVFFKHHNAAPWLKQTGKTSGKTTTDIAPECWHKKEGSQNDMHAHGKDLSQLSVMRECCCSTLFPWEFRGITLSKHLQADPSTASRHCSRSYTAQFRISISFLLACMT